MHKTIFALSSRILFTCAFLMLLCANSIAQSTIKGIITDSTNSHVPFVAVGLLNAKDSSVVKGTATNDSGAYSFTKIKPGRYLIKVQAMNYVNQYSKPVNVDSNTIQVISLR